MASREDVDAFMTTAVAQAVRQYFVCGKSAGWMQRETTKKWRETTIELKARFDAGDDDAARTVINIHIANVSDDLKRLENAPEDASERVIAGEMFALSFEKLRLEALLAVVSP